MLAKSRQWKLILLEQPNAMVFLHSDCVREYSTPAAEAKEESPHLSSRRQRKAARIRVGWESRGIQGEILTLLHRTQRRLFDE